MCILWWFDKFFYCALWRVAKMHSFPEFYTCTCTCMHSVWFKKTVWAQWVISFDFLMFLYFSKWIQKICLIALWIKLFGCCIFQQCDYCEIGNVSTGFSSPFVPKNSLQITRLRLVIWKEFSGTHGEENPVLTFPPHSIFTIPALCSSPCVYTENCSTSKSLVIFNNVFFSL